MADDKKDIKNDKPEEKKSEKVLQGSKSDPPQTELEGLKKGGVEPPVHPEDKEEFKEGDFAEKEEDKDDDV